jgi:hypothetical protein
VIVAKRGTKTGKNLTCFHKSYKYAGFAVFAGLFVGFGRSVWGRWLGLGWGKKWRKKGKAQTVINHGMFIAQLSKVSGKPDKTRTSAPTMWQRRTNCFWKG